LRRDKRPINDAKGLLFERCTWPRALRIRDQALGSFFTVTMPLRPRTLLLHILLVGLVACGGGGGGGGSGGGSSPAPGDPAPINPTLSGVVSVGAPLGGAALSVIDAKGTAVGTATAHPTDGTYRLTLSQATPSLPLLVQARGLDSGGQWTVQHSIVPALTSSTTAHVTPLTQALAALALGSDPASAFIRPADSTLAATPLAQVNAASDFLKTIIKTGLADAKISDSAGLNLLTDAGFATSKSAADLLVEALRVVVEPGTPPLLTLSSKFLTSPAAEVTVALGLARTELLKGSTGTPANAIVSPLKVTSAAATVMANTGSLDGLVAALNPLLAQGANVAAIQASPVFTGYTRHDGRTAEQLATLLAGWGTRGLQLGPLQVLGCADEVLKAGDCLRVVVASVATDRAGQPAERWVDAVTWNASLKRWNLIGNGRNLSFDIRAASWLRLDATGKAETTGTNPNSGVEIQLQGRTADNATALLTSATVQTPLGYALPLANCQRPLMCLSKPGDATAVSSGGPSDHLLQPGVVGWLGAADALRGARYTGSFTPLGTSTPELRRSFLSTSAVTQAAARHPSLDGVSSTAALTADQLRFGLKLKWETWAVANPELRLVQVRAVVRYADRVSLRELDAPATGFELTIPPTGAVGGLAPTGYDVWLIAVNPQGLRLLTRYALPV
jgi:hypothetical protein